MVNQIRFSSFRHLTSFSYHYYISRNESTFLHSLIKVGRAITNNTYHCYGAKCQNTAKDILNGHGHILPKV